MLSGLSDVRSFLSRNITEGDRLLVAVSGGADSIGLLACLSDELGIPASRLVCGHVTHGIRRDGHRDLEVIHDVAGKRSIPVCTRSVDTLSLAKEKHLSLEAAARELRYQSLTSMAAESACKWILTAHTMDDCAETVLMRMRSGAPWYEWTGIPARRGLVLRPLLCVLRDDLRGWVSAKGLRFHDDESNLDVRFRRNGLRAKLRERPDYWNPQQIRRFHAAGEELAAVLSVWSKMVYAVPVTVKGNLNEGTVGLAIDEIFRYFDNLTFLPVEVTWSALTGQRDARLPSKLRRQITTFLCGGSPQACLVLPRDISLLRRGALLWMMRGSVQPVFKRVSLGKWAVPERQGVLTIGKGHAANGGAICVRSQVMERELTVRNWQPGDRIKPAGRPTKKISDLLAEMKLDPVQRARVLVLADELGPLMILGGVVDQRAAANHALGESVFVSWSEGESIGAGHVV